MRVRDDFNSNLCLLAYFNRLLFKKILFKEITYELMIV